MSKTIKMKVKKKPMTEYLVVTEVLGKVVLNDTKPDEGYFDPTVITFTGDGFQFLSMPDCYYNLEMFRPIAPYQVKQIIPCDETDGKPVLIVTHAGEKEPRIITDPIEATKILQTSFWGMV